MASDGRDAAAVKRYRVATFYDADGRPRRSKVRAYLRDYNEAWDNCIVYDVDAKSGPEAKRLAQSMRYEHEKANWVEAHL